jgi:uncharacterized protein (DUF1919 family)
MSTEFDRGWVIGFIEGEGSFTHDWLRREGKKIRDFCEGKLKHPMKKEQFEEWKKLFANIRGKEAQREKAREEMIKRWEDPSYREKVLNAIKPYWDRKVRSILAKKGWERRRRKLDAKGS